mgnify:CR=1 FL=1
MICGLASNCAERMKQNVLQLSSCFSSDELLAIHVVESDSTDDTIQYLKNFKHENGMFSSCSLGDLKARIPNRVERIQFCRENYVAWLRESALLLKADAVLVTDFDIEFHLLTRKRLDYLLMPILRNHIDAIFPNIHGPYYDLYALRCDGWVMTDVWEDVSKFRTILPLEECLEAFIYSKQIKLGGGGLLPVQSAFGGLGVYKPSVFRTCNYAPWKNVCEHLTLHQNMMKFGFDRLAISLDADIINPPCEHIRKV